MSASITKNQEAPRWSAPAVCLVLAAITLAVFGRTLTHEFINFDDNAYVYDNPVVAGGLSVKGVARVFTHADFRLYIPLTTLSFMVNDQLHGLQPGGYHLTNVLLHTASVVLLFLILRRMTGAFWRSAFVAAVFAIHPLRAESVAWVAERKDVLSGFFFMLTLGAYVHYVGKPNALRYLMVAIAFVLALLSKPTVVTLPFVLLLLDYWPLQRMQTRKLSRLILEKIPLLALAAAACVITVLAEGHEIAVHANVSLLGRLGNALVSYAVYLRQMVWPEGLAAFYPQLKTGYPVWAVALSFLLLAVITGGVLVFRRKRPWLLTGWFWYLGMLIPMISIVQVVAFAHADRYTYLPQIGIYVAVTWLVAESGLSRVALCRLMAGTLAALMVLAWKQTAYWKNSETLWTHALACTTQNDTAEFNLGNALYGEGKLDAAITPFQIALQINPDYAEAYYNLGNIFRDQGHMDEAISSFEKALAIDPDYVDAHVNLGHALLAKGQTDNAISHFKKALEITPDFAEAQYDLANAFWQQGHVGEAILHYNKALEIEPHFVEAQNNLAWLLATAAEPSLRNGRQAVELARQANENSGGANPLILHTLAAALAEAGQFSDAVSAAQKAIALARAAGRQDLAEQFNGELKRYGAGLPLHGATAVDHAAKK